MTFRDRHGWTLADYASPLDFYAANRPPLDARERERRSDPSVIARRADMRRHTAAWLIETAIRTFGFDSGIQPVTASNHERMVWFARNYFNPDGTPSEPLIERVSRAISHNRTVIRIQSADGFAAVTVDIDELCGPDQQWEPTEGQHV